MTQTTTLSLGDAATDAIDLLIIRSLICITASKDNAKERNELRARELSNLRLILNEIFQ